MSVFMKMILVGAELFHVDRQTDVKKLIVTFCDFANAAKNICIVSNRAIFLFSNLTRPFT